jgi:hypothetical protein
MADLDVAPGQSISVTYDVSVSEPAESTTPIIDQNGDPSTPDEYSVELQSITAPTIFWGTSLSPSSLGISASAASCAPADLQNAQGQTLNFTCGLTFSIDSDYTLPDYLKDSGQMIVPQLTTAWEYTFDDSTSGITDIEQYGIGTSVFAAIEPSPTWLPSAADHSFRVEADKTLTITRTGLLQGASWSQGSVQGLDTYVTNVPSGGTVQANGDLQFTSAQVGNYAFNYYLQDPASQLRSQDATGKIQVYADATISAPITPKPIPTTLLSSPPKTPVGPVVDTGGYRRDESPSIEAGIITGLIVFAGFILITYRRDVRRKARR